VSSVTEGYLATVASVVGLDPSIADRPGTTVAATEGRRGERLVSHYHLGRHSVLWCDPDVVANLLELDGRDTSLEFAEFERWAMERGVTRLGGGLDHVLPAGYRPPDRAGAIAVLDGASPITIDLVADLLDRCPEDDGEDADFDLEALDPYLVGWMDDDGLRALAGARPWDDRPGYHDIGVLVHPGSRRHGLGAQVVAALTTELLMRGEQPLYRCSTDNVGSAQLCRRVGFELAIELVAYRWPS
jgi:GNAT superfamily N-acetyltransferase